MSLAHEIILVTMLGVVFHVVMHGAFTTMISGSVAKDACPSP
ncbi:MAG: hypothetical protein OGMRLDGQ_001204 [Candidatus Fervidibacter sp.]